MIVESTARLIDVSAPTDPTSVVGVVLVLHGGAARQGRTMVSPTQLSVLRMIPTARAVARAGGDRLAVLRLLNTYRGWDGTHTPVADVDWALGQLADRFPDRPVGLVGHSLGGRAALLAGNRRSVRSVVALNPWLYPSDGVDLAGRRVLFVHGMQDRIAPPQHAEGVAARLARTADVEFVRVPDGKHAMLRHGRTFDRTAAEFTAETLLAGDPIP